MITRRDLRAAAESNTVLNVNGHTVTVRSTSQTASGGWRFDVIIDGTEIGVTYFDRIKSLCGLVEKKEREVTVIPKSQKAKVTANNKGRVVTYKYNRGILSVADIQGVAYQRIDTLRAEQRRIDREIDLLLTLTRQESFDIEERILHAQNEELQARKKQLQARKEMLQRYIDTYDTRTVERIKADQQAGLAYMLQKEARIKRAEALICLLTINQ